MTFKDLLLVIVAAAVILLIGFAVVSLIKEQNDCNERGGVYVRQALGYGCLMPRER